MSWLIERIQNFKDITFLKSDSTSFSYQHLYSEITKHVSIFKSKGILAGDVVYLCGDYNLESVAGLLALSQLRAVVVPLVETTDAEFKKKCQVVSPQWIVHPSVGEVQATKYETSDYKLLEELKENERSGLILFSSGSTGEPKAMIHDFNRLLSSFESRRPRPITMMIFLLFDHIGGLNTLFGAIASGNTLVATQDRNPHTVCKLIEQHRVRFLPASPTFLNLLLMSDAVQKYNLSSLRIISYGTEPMPSALLNRLKKTFPRTHFLQTFGTSETGISQTKSKSSASNLFKFDDPNLEVKIVNQELWLRSSTQVLGYLNAGMERFTEDGWFRTGDLVEEAEDGYIRVMGRKSEFINVGGEKVLPQEVEQTILELDSILDCEVFGMQNPITGQTVVAHLVLKNPAEFKTVKRAVRKHCKARLDDFKVPTKIVLKEATLFSRRFKKVRKH